MSVKCDVVENPLQIIRQPVQRPFTAPGAPKKLVLTGKSSACKSKPLPGRVIRKPWQETSRNGKI